MMYKIEFSQAEIDQLNQQKKYHPHPRVRERMTALYYKSQGYSHQDIGKILGITQATLRSYLRLYMTGGVEKLKQVNASHFENPLAERQTENKTEPERQNFILQSFQLR